MSLHFLVRSNPLQRVNNRLKPVTTNTSGFTLMEMMIVIAIMLLLVIATLPRIKYALDESKVRESSRQLNSYFAMAKSRAASTGRPCGLWFVTEQVGNTTPGVFQSTQLYLAEIPPPYSGDILESRVIVHGDTIPSFPTSSSTRWLLQFSPGANSLLYLVADGETFLIRFDHKGPIFSGFRNGNQFELSILNAPTLPPHANGDLTNNPYAGYQYEIVRNAQRIGAPLALPRGTTVDLTYSGFGNSGTEFSSSANRIVVLFTPTGRVGNVTYSYYNTGTSSYVTVPTEATGTLHFLVGRPEKVLNFTAAAPLGPNTNIVDNNALWVSIGRLTGSVVTTDNAYTENPTLLAEDNPLFNPANPLFSDYMLAARKFARTQDVRGGQ